MLWHATSLQSFYEIWREGKLRPMVSPQWGDSSAAKEIDPRPRIFCVRGGEEATAAGPFTQADVFIGIGEHHDVGWAGVMEWVESPPCDCCPSVRRRAAEVYLPQPVELGECHIVVDKAIQKLIDRTTNYEPEFVRLVKEAEGVLGVEEVACLK